MTPYARQYEEAIIAAGHEYDIVFWDRFSNAPMEKRENEFIFHRVCSLGGNRLKKIYPFYLFRKNIKRLIEKGNYDKIIILNTMPGFLLLFLHVALKNFWVIIVNWSLIITSAI